MAQWIEREFPNDWKPTGIVQKERYRPVSATLDIHFMDDTNSALPFGRENGTDNQSWQPRRTGLHVRHSDGGFTVFPWHNVKHYSVTVDRGTLAPSANEESLIEERPLSYLRDVAAELAECLRRSGLPPDLDRQVLKLSEEAGEVVGAYNRYAGHARRTGTAADVLTELADLVVTAYITAHEMSGELDMFIHDKVAEILSRESHHV